MQVDEKNVYALDVGKNSHLTMTKEQILTAIMQAVNNGTIGNIDAGFVTKLQEINEQKAIRLWIGSTAQFQTLETKDEDTLYILTDDSTVEDIEAGFSELDKKIKDIVGGNTTVDKAKKDGNGKEISSTYLPAARMPYNVVSTAENSGLYVLRYYYANTARYILLHIVKELDTVAYSYDGDINNHVYAKYTASTKQVTLHGIDLADEESQGYVELRCIFEYPTHQTQG